MKYMARFWRGLQRDGYAFIYWCVLLTLWRAAFIACFSGQLGGDYSSVPGALWLGARLSLKTAGVLMTVGILFATIPGVFVARWAAEKIRYGWHLAATVVFTFLFMARIPYYRAFNAAFDMHMLNGLYDDKAAILATVVQEYQLLPRLAGVAVIALGLAYILRGVLLRTRVVELTALGYPRAAMAGALVFLAAFAVFVRYGGAFSFAAGVNYQNAARFPQHLLNEAVLDDGQALYRVRSIQKELAAATKVDITPAELRKKIAAVGGKPADNIEAAFTHTVQQPKIGKQPDNIVIVVGESLGNWAMLPEFRGLGLADNLLALAESPHGAQVGTMLAHGGGTVDATNAIIAGVPSVGLYENYRAGDQQLATGLGYILKQLGYRTVFWYGGFAGWQNLENFARAQSFDEFYGAESLGSAQDASGGNAWGCPDELLLESVASYIDRTATGERVAHVVLTTSNHPPYSIDVDSAGFPRADVAARLPDSIASDEATLTELGHYWYADKTIGELVRTIESAHPDTLFVITGDHSERFSFKSAEDTRTLSTIPCIFYGAGVAPEWFGDKSVGTALQIAGTIAEIVAPPGFSYTALLPSMFSAKTVFNHRLYATDGELAEIAQAPEEVRDYAANLRTIAAYYVLRGNKIVEP